ncbi:MAG TPA: sigma-54-dependent Fis family transcriptional regulator [Candidatus Eisenbacteria bacterium]|nr:sigma-54-dependent Fis family transcriptional regulator [Candidatus Eisenbacteria bacterium]
MSEPDRPTAEIIESLRDVLCQVAEPIVVLGLILQHAVRRTRADRGLFVEVLEGGDLEFRVLNGFREDHFQGDAGAFSRNLFARVMKTGREIVLQNASQDPDFSRFTSVQRLRAGGLLCMPIRSNGRILALVHLENRNSGHFTAQHVELLRSLLAVAAPVLIALRAGNEVMQERDRLRTSESRFREEAVESRQRLAADWSFGRFIGRSGAVRQLETAILKAASTDYPVLLLGEPGTGKSILARVLHYASARAESPLTTVFCPSLERGMVEAELFGHKRGAFTGAISDRIGRVQAADGGTLFLDEIGELPLEIQPKLLRFLQERAFERVGDSEERTADVRIVAATNRDLAFEVQQGRFRRDLFDRLNFLPIRVPPLRERPEDIPLMLRHCLDLTASGRWIDLAPEASEFLQTLDFAWPGNVRHVEHLAARLTTEGKREPIGPADIMRLLDTRETAVTPDDGADLEAGLPTLIEDAERRWLEQAVQKYSRLTREELATKLQISESALYRKLRRYGIDD